MPADGLVVNVVTVLIVIIVANNLIGVVFDHVICHILLNNVLNIYLAGGRREPRVVRVDGGRGERMESQSAL